MLGKLIGGIAGLAAGGPLGAVVGAALGHVADSSGFTRGGGSATGRVGAAPPGFDHPALTDPDQRLRQIRLLAMLGQQDKAFALGVTVLAARLAKIDGVVTRAEIAAFKRHFRISSGQEHAIGQVFDAARDGREPYEPYARELGRLFADAPNTLEDVLGALFAIARADGALTRAEHEFLVRVHAAFGISHAAYDRAAGNTAGGGDRADPYALLGEAPTASNETLRLAWKRLVRENHPDSLASRGVPPDLVARASDRMARINAAWDRIKRERGLT